MKKNLILTLLLCLALGATSARAASQWWDINGATPGAGGATPAGTWDTGTTANWTTDSTGASATTTWSANDSAFFSAGADASGSFTVTIPSLTTIAAAGLTVEEGTILLGPGTLNFGTANGLFDIASGATLNISGAGSGFVVGTGGITKSSPGVLFLGGSEGYTNSSASGALLTINGGTVDFSGETALGLVPALARAAAVTINGGTLRYSGTTALALNVTRGVTIGASGGTIEVTSTAATGLSLPGGATFTLNGGSGAVTTKTGAGRFTMNTTANTYTGKYIVLAGSINVPGDGRLGTVPASPQADHLTLNGSTASLRIAVTTSTTLNANRGITLGAIGGALQQPGPGVLIYNGIIAGTSGGTLRIEATDAAGGGTTSGHVILGGASTYDGPTTIVGGMSLKLGAAGVIPDSSVVTPLAAGATFDMRGGYVPSCSITTGGSGYTTVPTVTFSAPPAGGVTAAGTATIASGAVTGIVMSNPGSGYASPPTITFGGPGTGASATATTVAIGTFNETIKSVSGTAGTIAVGAATLTLADPAGETYSSVFSGVPGGKIVKNGTGALILGAGSSTGWTGEWVINNGTIGIGGNNNFGNAAGATVTMNGGKLANTAGGGRTIPAPVVLNIAGDFTVDDSLFTTAANGQILFNGGAVTLKNGTRTINVDGPNGQVTNLRFDGAVGEDAAGRGIIKTGSGILVLNNAANTYSGDTTVSGGTLQVDADGTLGNGVGALHLSGGKLNISASRTAAVPNPVDLTADTAVTTSSAATTVALDFSSSTVGGGAGMLTFRNEGADAASDLFDPRFSGSGFNFSPPIVIDNGPVGQTRLNSFNTTGTDQTFSGTISGNGSYQRSASAVGTGGRTIFTAANTYSGGTTVSRGTLLVNNITGSGTGSGAVTVGSDGTLAGTGTIGGAVTVSGTLAPGASIGTLTFGSSLTLSGTTSMEINKTLSAADKIVMSSGTVTLGGNLTVVNLAGTLAVGDTFDLIDGTIAGAFSSFTLPAPAGLTWDTSQLAAGGDGTIKVICDGTLTASAGPNQTACAGVGVTIGGSPTASSGSGSGYTYLWSPATGLSSTTVANPTASPTSMTSYTVTVTDANGCTATSPSVTVTVAGPPTISTQPANQTACDGSTAQFSVVASGQGTLSYSWAKRNNGGWGSAWSTGGSGATFRGSSSDDNFGDPACTGFSSAGDINSPSGNALGMWGGFSGDEAAVRTFAALTAGQVVSIDFDNGNVDSGSKVGFSLQTSGGADVLQFYFLGGQSNYNYNDGVEQDTGIGFQRTGLRVQFVLISSGTYSLSVTPCGGTTKYFAGSYSGTIAQLKLFNQNNTGGNDKNIYFNNFLVGGYEDNADNYSGDYAGQDKGNQPILSGNGGSTYTTPTLTTGDNGTQYEVVVYGCGGTVLSSAATLTVNPRPTSVVSGDATICSGGSTTIQAVLTGTGPWDVTWSDSFTQTGVSSSPATRSVSPSSTTIYTATALSDANCTTQAGDLTGSATVTVNPRPTAVVSGDATICNGQSTIIQAALTGTGPWNVTWSDAVTQTGVSTSPATRSVSPSSTTVYTVTALVDANCTALAGDLTGSATVSVNPRPTSVVSGGATICPGGSANIQAVLTGTGPWSVQWSDEGSPDTVLSSPAMRTVSPGTTTTYTVTILSDANCTALPGDLTGSATVTVEDTALPLITCASNKIVECGSAWTFDAPTASDACCGTNVTITILSTVTNGTGCSLMITQTWQATDCNSNSATCSQIVTVVDTTAPALTCVTNKTVECGAVWTFDEPSALDVCSGTNVTISVLSTLTNGAGCSLDITRSWQATDPCTNSSTCSQTVTVADTTAPVLTCATNKTVECGSVWSFDDPSALDACSGTNVTISVLSTLTNGAGCSLDITRTWQATDPCTNSSTCSQTVTIVDTTAPVLTCVPNKTIECGSAWSFDDPGALDACSAANLTIIVLGTITNGTGCSLDITRTWQATDLCTNSSTCSQTVTVVDTTAPVLACVPNKTVECGAVWTFDHPSALDVCSGTNVTISVLNTLTNGAGCSLDITRTWQATDPCTNNSTCSQTVSIVDTTAPVLTCSTNKTVQCGSAWTFDEPSALDACSSTNLTISILNTITNGTGCSLDITRTWQATDLCTNSSTCSQTVTVIDTTAPSLTCATNKNVECGAVWTFDEPSALDACSGTNLTVNILSTVTNGSSCSLEITRTWQATDPCTNSSTCSQTVTVVDTTAPVLACVPDKTVGCASAWSFDEPSALDACSGTDVTVTVLGTITNNAYPKVITRTWQAADPCTNSSTCSQSVTLTNSCVPPAIASLSYSGTTFTLSFLSQAGVTYDVEYKNSLTDPTWTLLESDTGTGGIITVTDTTAAPVTRFYRVICRCQ